MPPFPEIGIVGCGLSGSLTLINLLSTAAEPLRVTVFERDPKRTGRGIAYSNDYTYQPLNVSVEGMSLYEDRPLHFYNWLLQHESTANLPYELTPRSFVSRHWFGDYLTHELYRCIERHPQHRVTFVHDEVIRLRRRYGKPELATLSNARFRFDKLVLALGNFLPGTIPSEDMNYVHHPHYEANPWRDGLLDDVSTNEKVLFVGSGLTTVDLLVNLKLAKHEGKIYVLSRNGRLPSTHIDNPSPVSVTWNESDFTKGLLHLLKTVRSKAKAVIHQGGNWQHVIDSLRPHTPRVWQQLSHGEMKTFVGRLRVFWETHRHRMTQASHDYLKNSFSDTGTELMAGKVKNIQTHADGFVVTYKPKDAAQTRSLFVHRIVNCTGPESNYRNIDRPLVRDMLFRGMAAQDALALGLQCDAFGALVNVKGRVDGDIYALGPLRRGTEWESTALREIRRQAVNLATKLLEPVNHQGVLKA
jgi:uncharacterized NAD(P)/FAD-binding protein YdhS